MPTALTNRFIKLLSAFTDMILWGGILLLIGGVIYYFTIIQYANKQQVITIPFQDANEISRGAAVRMMGTEVGYVDNIKLTQQHVNIIIKTFPDSLTIPSGSTFTVLFTGLGGSKSIEIVPPAVTRPSKDNKPVYIPEQPIRLKQALQYQIDIAKALQEGAENFTNFFGNRKPAEMLQYNILKSRDATQIAKNYLTHSRDVLQEKQKDVGNYIGNFSATVDGFAVATEKAKEVMDPKYMGPSTYATVRYFTLLFTESQASMRSFEAARGVRRVNRKIINADRQLTGIAEIQVTAGKKRLIGFEQKMAAFNRGVRLLDEMIRPHLLQEIKAADAKIRAWDATLKKMNRKL